jgi:DNA-binding transcriptional LysR family regulator
VDEQKLPPPTLFDTFQMSSEAAANGFGVALMFPMVSERFLASGRLVPCFAPRQPISGRYWLIKATTLTIESAARSERVSKWLKQEAQKSLCAFAAYA